MSLDAFAVVVAFLAIVEVSLGFAAVAAALRPSRAGPDLPSANPRLALTAASLLVVAIVSCPILYLLLESWVPRWPGIMCVEGVRRIGTGSVGASGWLPGLLGTLDITKPIVVLAAGAWLVIRRAGDARLRVANAAAVVLGLAAVLDGAVQAAYVAIPKESVPAVAGCCTMLAPGETPDAVPSFVSTHATAWFPAGAVLLGAVALALALTVRAGKSRTALLALLASASLGIVPFGAAFLADVAAPVALGLQFHHCAWCALAGAPETLAGAALFGAAVLAAVWATVARLADVNGDRTLESRLLTASAFGFLGTAAMSASFCWSA